MRNLLLAIMVLFSLPAAIASNGPVHTKKIVDVESFVGKWYTISSLPQFVNRKCLLQICRLTPHPPSCQQSQDLVYPSTV